MKRFRKLFALLLALVCCLALLPVSAMADPTFTYVKGSGKNLSTIHKNARGDFLGRYTARGSNGSYPLHNGKEFTIIDRLGDSYLVLRSSFLESLPNGNYRISAGNFSFTVKSAVNDWPPATPTDLSGGSDEPDEVLYIGGMKGAGAAAAKGGKPADSAAAAAVSAAQTQQVVILPENAPAANPATGAEL